ncbi:DUF3822 family protein [Bacteroides sedimenti]|uniref:DUF3822 family protein n=1 Tax=Bacteroides sedimenti TaxID=2136147 RepID=A0ABM8IET7_9BACE
MTEEVNTPQIDYSRTGQYTLTVRLTTEEFFYSIYNPTNEKAYSFLSKATNENLSMAANVKDALKENEFLKHSYKRVNVLVVTRRFTLIPFELFEDEQAETILYHNHPRQDNEVVLYNILKKANVVVVFAIDKSVYQQMKEQFPDASFYCHASTLAEYYSGLSKQGNNLKMYACLREKSVDVLCYERGRLLLINNFKCSATSDIIYYLLYVWKELDFNQERDELHLSGNFADKEGVVNGLKRFVRQLFVIKPDSVFSSDGNVKTEKIPFDLQALSLCDL